MRSATGPVERISFTEAERLTLVLLCRGYSNKAIAANLGVLPTTVNNRIPALSRFVGLSGSSRELIVWCFEDQAVLEKGYRDMPLAA